ncbi:hypothetical protein H0A36_13925 [Endozoicomonas sp. SM1973]|uniref:DNA gyrase subunit B n=1 Tax=Spartinivicinus marinus TaxID=2994442 RepID=A0A853IAQ1_9GAMM|nr:ATP-binding protein [Spartinivicinus marinus]MCX4028620.1 ATP-binding protein [Spartinivicinus marinus]NYZ67114.1 hypothetical protein [Spartinivicinus marinus]
MADKYDSNNIVVLKGLDAVRKRPGMYVGDLDDGTGLIHMLMEVVSNSVDQFLADKASVISVLLHENGDMEVIDDGEGIPIHELHGKSALEVIMTTLHTGATWDNHRPHTHVGTTIGIGLAPINALCDYFEVDSFKDGTHWYMRFDNAEAGKLENKGATDKTGTRMLFHPSKKYFTHPELDEKLISSRLKELSFLCAGLKFQFQSKQHSKLEEYYCPNGIIGYLEKVMPSNDSSLLPILHFEAIEQNTKIELALCWSSGLGYQHSFANHLCTKDGGVHVDAVILGLIKAASIKSSSQVEIETWTKRLSKGLYLIVHVNIADPKFASPTKDRLINEEVFSAVIEATYQQAKEYFSKNWEFFFSLEFHEHHIIP